MEVMWDRKMSEMGLDVLTVLQSLFVLIIVKYGDLNPCLNS